ncbi:hypothetical protein GCE86_06715 [Micromonospora terminaliae]|uniref:Uncharacterized protein n=1 Tax=Micromonospora terminaliae TaxID=1914461 RepID=A0AAJ2ZJM4_9ACTN|nr:hypothetical protein [Micromonospora terminaliae]NES30059.1 hypothetical protein [Micromonospora terminaliae]QGL46768.1 hypothetical protein GCE86_06715 [Micromonospora terminaliae]
MFERDWGDATPPPRRPGLIAMSGDEVELIIDALLTARDEYLRAADLLTANGRTADDLVHQRTADRAADMCRSLVQRLGYDEEEWTTDGPPDTIPDDLLGGDGS